MRPSSPPLIQAYEDRLGWRNKLVRLLWQVVWSVAFRPTPPPLHGWRCFLLRRFGATLGRGVHIYPSARIWAPWNLVMADHACLGRQVDCYNVAPVRIGTRAIISQYSYLCTASHDVADPAMRLVSAPIQIGDQAWVCADVFVGPGVTIGAAAVAGARSSVFSDLPAGQVCVGSPARAIRPRTTTRDTPEATA